MDMQETYLQSVKKQFAYYKALGEKAIGQLEPEQLFVAVNDESNSIAVIVKHLWGNMMSRWTDFLTTDGEKAWRNRDAEFENDTPGKEELLAKWNEGWGVFLQAIDSLTPEQLSHNVHIRNEVHTVLDAINRQLAHYPYHVGQIVHIAKMLKTGSWSSLSIPKRGSRSYNETKLAQDRAMKHAADGGAAAAEAR